MKVAVIANPVAGRGRHYRKVRKFLESRKFPGCEFEFLLTRGQGDAGRLASGLLAKPPDLLAVCGGDGTMKEVVSCVPTPPFPVALLPGGTANVLAREIGLPLDPVRAFEIALRRRTLMVDLPALQGNAGHHFLLMAGIGFDAYVTTRVRPSLKSRIGILAYYLGVLQGLREYDFAEFKVMAGGRAYSASTCVVANARGYGGGLALTPLAEMTDGKLDLLIIGKSSRLKLAAFVLSAKFGAGSGRFRFIERLRAESITISGPPGIWVQLDGEPIGTLPVEISLRGEKFPLVVP